MDHFNDIQRQRGEPYVKPKSRTSAGALVWFELMDLRSVITCPACGEKEEEIMPTDFCQWYYDCSFCGELLRPKKVIVVCFVPTEVIRAHPSRAAKAVARSQPVLDA
jgi:hypothetical protein